MIRADRLAQGASEENSRSQQRQINQHGGHADGQVKPVGPPALKHFIATGLGTAPGRRPVVDGHPSQITRTHHRDHQQSACPWEPHGR